MNDGVPQPGTAGTLGAGEFAARLRTGIGLRIGPFDAFLRVGSVGIARALHDLYRDYPLLDRERVFSFHAALDARRSPLPFGKAKVRFSVDGRAPHEDMPAGQSLAVLEWGINLVIAMRAHCFLMLHAAAVSHRGGTMLLPAAPGSGKTTLCAGLALRGWRLYSDEFGLLRPGGIAVTPVPRPLALKNESIDVIRRFSPHAWLGPEIPGTRKGTVAHLRPPANSVTRASQCEPARWIVYPQWRDGSACRLDEIASSDSFMQLATNAFNYEHLGESGFDTVRGLVESTRSYRLVYSDLDEAVAALAELAGGHDH